MWKNISLEKKTQQKARLFKRLNKKESYLKTFAEYISCDRFQYHKTKRVQKTTIAIIR